MSHPIRLFLELVGTLAALLLIATGVLLWRLSVGPITVPFVTPLLEAALRDSANGMSIDVGDTSLDWSASSRSIQLRVLDTRVLASDGAEIVHIPQAWLSLSINRLLHGEIQPEALRVQGLRLNLARNAEGTLQLQDELPAADAAATAGAAPAEGGSRFVSFLIAELAAPADPRRPLGLLAEAVFADTTIAIDDAASGLRFGVEGANVALRRYGGGIALQAALPAVLGAQRLRFDVDALYRVADAAIAFSAVAGAINVAALADLDPRLAALRNIDATARLELRSTLALDGTLGPVALALDADGLQLRDRSWYAQAVTLDRAGLRATLAGDLSRVDLDALTLRIGETEIRATAEIPAPLQRAQLDAKIDIAGLTTDELKRLWPLFASPNARSWIAENIAGGRIPAAKAELSLREPKGDWANAAVEKLRFDFSVEGAAVTFIDGLPPVRGVAATATMDAKRLEMRTRGGTVGSLQVGNGTVALAGLDQALQTAAIDVPIVGPARDALQLVDLPPLGFLKRIGEQPENFGGAADMRIVARFPLLAALKLDDIAVVASGRVANFTQRNAILGNDIENGTLAFRVDAKGLDIRGPVRLAGADAEIVYRREFEATNGPVETATARAAAVSTRSVNRLGFDFAPYAVGPVGLAMTTRAFRDGTRDIGLELDLAAVDFAVPEIDWTRAPTAGTKLAMTLRLERDVLRAIERLDLAGAGIAAKGRVEFEPDGRTFKAADLQRLLLAGRIDLDTAAIKREAPARPGGLMYNSFEGKGAFFDAQPFLADKTPPVPGRPGLRLGLDVARVALGEGRDLFEFSLHGHRDDVRWLQLEISAKTMDRVRAALGGELAVSIVPGADGLLTLKAAAGDAGALLAALDITPNVVGGTLRVDGKEDPARADRAIVGKIAIEEFRLVNAPGFAKLLSVALLTGVLDSLRGDGIGFRRLDADIAWADPKIEIKDGRMHGAALGITARGQVDLAADTLDLEGTLVPAYALNSILGNIPLIGQLLVGERGSGVFAANYRASGAMADVQTSINPLSTLTPGFLRRLFGVFSGSGGATNAPADGTPVDPYITNDNMR
ncbi:MAG: AsmA-like C-terminal domain-containing protein [Telmatospirillum sp.]|nr:AsmA-like C-terminal domain-containing protein [Telmatospirillum sp.]